MKRSREVEILTNELFSNGLIDQQKIDRTRNALKEGMKKIRVEKFSAKQ